VDSPQARTLRQAVERVGGVSFLARHLGVKPRELEAWLAGEADVPAFAFFEALDIVSGRFDAEFGVRA